MSKLYYDIFANGRWSGMAEGDDEDDAKRMVARCLPQLLGIFTLVPWHGKKHPDNCKTSGGNTADPLPEFPFLSPAAALLLQQIAAAFGTAEEGISLIDVARNAHRAELELANFKRLVREVGMPLPQAYSKLS